jgi:hypothetical protein
VPGATHLIALVDQVTSAFGTLCMSSCPLGHQLRQKAVAFRSRRSDLRPVYSASRGMAGASDNMDCVKACAHQGMWLTNTQAARCSAQT